MKKYHQWLSLFLILFILPNLYSQSKSDNISLIISTDFVNPRSTYDSIITNIIKTGFADSIKVFGRPLQESRLSIEIDTVRADLFKVPLELLYDKILRKTDSIKNIQEFNRLLIENRDGNKIPLSSFVSLVRTQDYYKPEIFIPEPEVFYYRGNRAVKIEIYPGRGYKDKLIKFIENNLQSHADVLDNRRISIDYVLEK